MEVNIERHKGKKEISSDEHVNAVTKSISSSLQSRYEMLVLIQNEGHINHTQ